MSKIPYSVNNRTGRHTTHTHTKTHCLLHEHIDPSEFGNIML